MASPFFRLKMKETFRRIDHQYAIDSWFDVCRYVSCRTRLLPDIHHQCLSATVKYVLGCWLRV